MAKQKLDNGKWGDRVLAKETRPRDEGMKESIEMC